MVIVKSLPSILALALVGCSSSPTPEPAPATTTDQQAVRDTRPYGFLDQVDEELAMRASEFEAQGQQGALAQNRIWARRYHPERRYGNGITTATGANRQRMHEQAIERTAQMLTRFGWNSETVTDEGHARRLVEASGTWLDSDPLDEFITLAPYVVVADLLAVVPTDPDKQFQSMVAQYRVVESIKGGVPAGSLFQTPQPNTSEMVMPGATGRFLVFLYVPAGSPSYWTPAILEGRQPPPPPGGVTWARPAFGRMPVAPDGTILPAYHGPEINATLDDLRKMKTR